MLEDYMKLLNSVTGNKEMEVKMRNSDIYYMIVLGFVQSAEKSDTAIRAGRSLHDQLFLLFRRLHPIAEIYKFLILLTSLFWDTRKGVESKDSVHSYKLVKSFALCTYLNCFR